MDIITKTRHPDKVNKITKERKREDRTREERKKETKRKRMKEISKEKKRGIKVKLKRPTEKT